MQKIELIFCVHTYFTYFPINLFLFIISYQILLRIELSSVRPGTHGVLLNTCSACHRHTCLKQIVCAPLFTAYVKTHVLFSKIGLVLPTYLIQSE